MPLTLEQRKIASDFPEVRWSETDEVCILAPRGTLTAGRAARLVAWLREIEKDREQPFSRFTDLSKVDKIEVSRLDLANVAYWRRTTYEGPMVKSAFLVGSKETYEVAHAYRSFMAGSPIFVLVFQSVKEAAAWLDVSPESLEEAGSG